MARVGKGSGSTQLRVSEHPQVFSLFLCFSCFFGPSPACAVGMDESCNEFAASYFMQYEERTCARLLSSRVPSRCVPSPHRESCLCFLALVYSPVTCCVLAVASGCCLFMQPAANSTRIWCCPLGGKREPLGIVVVLASASCIFRMNLCYFSALFRGFCLLFVYFDNCDLQGCIWRLSATSHS